MPKNFQLGSSITAKLLLSTGATIVSSLILIIALVGANMYETLFKLYEEKFLLEIKHTALDNEALNSPLQYVVDELLQVDQRGIYKEGELFKKYIIGILQDYEEIRSVYVILEPQDGGLGLQQFGFERDKTNVRKIHYVEDIGSEFYDLHQKLKINSDAQESAHQESLHWSRQELLSRQVILNSEIHPLIVDKKFVGSVVVEHAMVFTDTLKALGLDESTEYFVVNKEGILLFSNTSQIVEGKRFQDTQYKEFLGAFFDQWHGKDALKEHFTGKRRLLLGKDPIDGHNYYFAASALPDFDWLLVMRIPESAMINPIQQTLMKIVFIAAIGLIFVCIVLIWIARSITDPIQKAVDAVKTVAEGDLTAKVFVASRDETGELLGSIKNMNKNLNSLVGQVRNSSTVLHSTAKGLSEISLQQNQAIRDFGALTKQVFSNAENIATTSGELVATMEDVQRLTNETAHLAGDGKKNLSRMQKSMAALEKAAHTMSERLTHLNDKAKSISTVVDTIAKVADQTDMLSLSAAVEAEKAGKEGIGFAVVASEIRRLSDQTQMATEDIEGMITEVQNAVSAGVNGMQGFTSDVRRAVLDVEELLSHLGLIIERVQTLQPRFENVGEGIAKQSEGAQEINSSTKRLSNVATTTEDSLNEVIRASSKLKNAAEHLAQEFSYFRLGDMS